MKIHIPTPLRVYSNKQDTVSVKATTVGEALDELTAKHPELKKHLYSDEGKLRSFVNVYLNDEDIRYLPEKDATQVGDQDALSIIPSIAGGSSLHRHTGPAVQADAAFGSHPGLDLAGPPVGQG
jgi:adenylyltransferase/sulfurtransferase